MNASETELWKRIAAFPFDDAPVVLTFARRLAKETGWDRAFTRRVLSEYRRFVFLAVAAGHPVAPSEQVDQAWHLHLTYTRSYWQRLCGETLGRPLHHEPTRGGSGEQGKYIFLYTETLASYRRLFSEEPPDDIWPDAVTRFGADTQHRLVNTARNWVLPKRLVYRGAGVAIGLPSLLVVAASWGPVAEIVNPFNLRGPDFLKLYAVVAAIVIVAGLLMRRWLRAERIDPAEAGWRPGISDLAVLAEGPRRAAFAALVALVQRGGATIDNEAKLRQLLGFSIAGKPEYVVHRVDGCEIADSPLERALYDAIGPGAALATVPSLVKGETERITSDLRERQLLMEPDQAWWVRFGPTGLVGSLLLLAVPKFLLGISRDRPVGFLFLALAVTVLVLVGFLFTSRRRTLAGDRLLARLRKDCKLAEQHVCAAHSTPDDAAVAFALFGLAAIGARPARSRGCTRHSVPEAEAERVLAAGAEVAGSGAVVEVGVVVAEAGVEVEGAVDAAGETCPGHERRRLVCLEQPIAGTTW